MSYVAEPYAQFVNDVLVGLTGGVIRERFVFSFEDNPFPLSPPGPVVPGSLLVYGQVDDEFQWFQKDVDFELTPDNEIAWNDAGDGSPAPDATWPVEGTAFFVNYDHKGPSGPAPRLTDRNPGSVVRTLAESFAREYAVLSRQMEGVYKGAFVDTASGRDLDQLAALVGVTRRDQTHATGTVVFSRPTPAPADIFIPAGTVVSTREPPIAAFEISDDTTLHRGSLSAELAIRAVVSGSDGVVPGRNIEVIHRPILGISSVSNPQGTTLGGKTETDDMLRARVKRALESAARATHGALVGALATLPGVREKDVLVQEDYLLRPGILIVSIAAELDQASCIRALDLIEQHRPAGIRVVHRLDCPVPPEAIVPGANPMEGEFGDLYDSLEAADDLYVPVAVKTILVPASARLSASEREAIKAAAEAAIQSVVEDVGVGKTLVYNRIVAAMMEIEGVQDASLDLYPTAEPNAFRHRNLFPGATVRPTLADKHGGILEVRVAGELVALDVEVDITLEGAAAAEGPEIRKDLKDYAGTEVAAALSDGIHSVTTIDTAALTNLLPASENFTASVEKYAGEFVGAGVQLTTLDPVLMLSAEETPWIRSVTVKKAAP
ncbi:MAG: hypothetical protein GY847_09060 [Proteobacteria bacterium]|nr:hypothetical protein [Pseudomonadota bacterium]